MAKFDVRPVKPVPDERSLAAKITACVVVPLLAAMTKVEYRGIAHIPTGPYILVINHMSKIDPLILAKFIWSLHREPHFLAKSSLFEIPVAGKVLYATGQIPVYRETGGSDSMRAAKQALAEGKTIAIYPEGTLTRDPDLWPMKGKTGAVRLALETGVPLIPVAHWGANELLGRYTSKLRPFPRKKIQVRVGPPIDLVKYRDRIHDSAAIREASDAVILAITAELEHLRGKKSTQHIWGKDATQPESKTARKNDERNPDPTEQSEDTK